jgi:CheY-like chemotaxis protein
MRLRTHRRTAKALLIAVSGYGQAQDRARAMAAGFDHCVIKPVAPEVLSARIAQWRPPA